MMHVTNALQRLAVGESFSLSHWSNFTFMFLLFDIATEYVIGIVFLFCFFGKNYRSVLLQTF